MYLSLCSKVSFNVLIVFTIVVWYHSSVFIPVSIIQVCQFNGKFLIILLLDRMEVLRYSVIKYALKHMYAQVWIFNMDLVVFITKVIENMHKMSHECLCFLLGIFLLCLLVVVYTNTQWFHYAVHFVNKGSPRLLIFMIGYHSLDLWWWDQTFKERRIILFYFQFLMTMWNNLRLDFKVFKHSFIEIYQTAAN